MELQFDHFTAICIRIAKNAEAIANNDEAGKVWERASGVASEHHKSRRDHLCKMRAMLHYAMDLDIKARYTNAA